MVLSSKIIKSCYLAELSISNKVLKMFLFCNLKSCLPVSPETGQRTKRTAEIGHSTLVVFATAVDVSTMTAL